MAFAYVKLFCFITSCNERITYTLIYVTVIYAVVDHTYDVIFWGCDNLISERTGVEYLGYMGSGCYHNGFVSLS